MCTEMEKCSYYFSKSRLESSTFTVKPFFIKIIQTQICMKKFWGYNDKLAVPFLSGELFETSFISFCSFVFPEFSTINLLIWVTSTFS